MTSSEEASVGQHASEAPPSSNRRRAPGGGSSRTPPPGGSETPPSHRSHSQRLSRTHGENVGPGGRTGSRPSSSYLLSEISPSPVRITPVQRRIAEHVVKTHLRVAPDLEFLAILTRDLSPEGFASGATSSSEDEELLVAKITFNLAKFAFAIVQQIDQWVPVYGTHAAEPDAVQVLNSRPDCWNFFYYFYEVPLKEASEKGCGKFLLRCLCEWIVVHPNEELVVLCQNVAARVARLVDALNFLVSSLALATWDTLVNVRVFDGLAIPLPRPFHGFGPFHGPAGAGDAGSRLAAPIQASRPSLLAAAPPPPPPACAPPDAGGAYSGLPSVSALAGLFHHFTVDVETGALSGALSEHAGEFQNSEFRVVLVDNYGSLLSLLYELTKLKVFAESGVPVAVAVDLEGVRLSRHGAIALQQMCLSTDPYTVYIVDVMKLGSNAFEVATHSGTSIRRVMEDPVIRKVFFDPRHDVDALYHQYGVVVENVFDLQLAEVALRRARGLTVRYVIGLFKCLYQQDPLLTPSQKKLAEKINEAGKSLFEPEFGGNYEIFLERPLHPSLLVYASHDARYLLQLHDLFHNQLSRTDGDWYARVLDASQIRARWFMHEDYVTPTTEAPLL